MVRSVVLLFLTICLGTSIVTGEDLNSRNVYWYIEADIISFYHEQDVVVAEGNAYVKKSDFSLSAKVIIYDIRANKVYAYSNLNIKMDEDVLEGEYGEFDLIGKTGEVKKGQLFLKRNNVYLLADEIQKIGLEEYTAKNAVVSTCPLPKQAWSIKSEQLKITLYGNATGIHNRFNVRNFPVLYIPWVSVPINRHRKSGFLLPYITSSSRNGLEIEIPYFWAVNDSLDLTFYGRAMTERGWMQGVEVRYALSEESKGTIVYNTLEDRLNDNDFNKDGIIRGTDDRWWLRARINQELPRDVSLKLDLDLISDRDYLEEFDGGASGYDEINKLFLREYGRGLADKTDWLRPSILLLSKELNNTSFALEGKYYDNIILGEQDKTPIVLPKMFANTYTTRLLSDIYYSNYAEYVHYWREEGINYDRIRLEPGISYFNTIDNLFSVSLNANLDSSFYKKYNKDIYQNPKDFSERINYGINGDISTILRKNNLFNSYKHIIKPVLSYEYVPKINQDDLPYIDVYDRIEPKNRIKYSLFSYLAANNRDIMRLKIEQAYDNYGTGLSTREYFSAHNYFDFYDELMRRLNYLKRYNIIEVNKEFDEHKFTPFYMELELMPTNDIYFKFDSTYNIYGFGFTTANFLLRYTKPKLIKTDLEYRYSKLTEISEVFFNLYFKLHTNLYGIYQTRYSFEENSEIKSSYGIKYQGSCWALTTKYVKDQDEFRITFNIELLGIGNW